MTTARPTTDSTPIPLLTVMIPCWNAVGTIERAISSVLVEREIPLECLVVDDGSTDGTPDLVRSLAADDARLRLVALPSNVGVSEARNAGLPEVRGTWFANLDADDRLLPGAIPALVRPTVDDAVRVVVGQRVWTDGERTWISRFYDIPDIREPGRKSIATHPGLLYYASTTGKLIHRSVMDGMRFQGRVLGDQPWTIRAMLRAGHGIEVIDDVVYEWWRPPPDTYVPTITAKARSSAEQATIMAQVAPNAFREVSDEIDLRIADEVTRRSTKVAYLDRLIRSDLAGPVKRAVDRRDPRTDRLFAALADMFATVPPPILADSTALARLILRPPLRAWPRLTPAARRAYWAMVRPALRAGPTHTLVIDDRRGSVAALKLVRRVPGRLGATLGSLTLAFAGAGRRLRDRVRSVRPQT